MVITFLSLFGFIFFIYRKFKVSPEALPLLTILLQIIALYVSGLFGFLQLGAYAISIAGLILLILTFYDLAKKSLIGTVVQEVMRPGLVFFILGLLFIIYNLSDIYYTVYDDYSHWGTAVKFFHLHNRFAMSTSELPFAAYPPGLTSYLYYTSLYIGNSVGFNVAMQDSILLAVSSLFFRGIGWKQYFSLFLRIAIVPFVIYAFSMRGWQTLSADHVLGAIFGVSLICGYKYSREHSSSFRKTEDFLLLLATIVVLPLIKEIGFIFSLVSAGSYFLLRIYGDYKAKKVFRFKMFGEKESVYVMLLTLIPKISWVIFISINNIRHVVNINEVSFWDLVRSVLTGGDIELGPKIVKYFSALYVYDLPLGLTIPEAALVLIIVSIVVVVVLDRKERMFFSIMFSYVLIMFIVYSIIISYVYIILWPPRLLDTLNSADRYYGSYFLGWALLALMVSFSKRTINKKYKAFIWIGLLILMVGSRPALLKSKSVLHYKHFFVADHGPSVYKNYKNINDEIVGIKIASETIKQKIPTSSKIFIINENHRTKFKIKYHLLGRVNEIRERSAIVNSAGVMKDISQLRNFDYLVNMSDYPITIYGVNGLKHILPERKHGIVVIYKLEYNQYSITL